MALKYGPFNGPENAWDAYDLAHYLKLFYGNGVFPNPSNNLQVLAHQNMQTKVSVGFGFIEGHKLENDSEYILSHDIADGVLKRIDRIVMRANYLQNKAEILIKKGAPSSNPTAPLIVRNADYYEMVLADVLINNGATVITQANITDQRLNSNLCGVVATNINQLDTTTLFNQYQSWIAQQKLSYENDFENWSDAQRQEFDDWMLQQQNSFNNWMQQEQQDFDAWFATLQDLLDENVAAVLTNKVTTLETGLNELSGGFDSWIISNYTPFKNDFTQHKEQNASTMQKGHVQLSNDTNSSDETKAATPKAVKLAYDRAEQAFQSASDGKTTIANAITGKGQSASGSDTFAQLATKISAISTGKKFASGTKNTDGAKKEFTTYSSDTTTQTLGVLTVSGLTFEPSIIVIISAEVQSNQVKTITNYLKNVNLSGRSGSQQISYSTGSSPQRVISLGGNSYVNASGFSLPIDIAVNYPCYWFAIE